MISHLVSYIESICTSALSTVILSLKHKPCHMSCQQKSNTIVAAKLRHPRNYKKLMLEGIPIKLKLNYFCLFLLLLLPNIYALSRFFNA